MRATTNESPRLGEDLLPPPLSLQLEMGPETLCPLTPSPRPLAAPPSHLDSLEAQGKEPPGPWRLLLIR